MYTILTQQIAKNLKLKDMVAEFVETFYTLKKSFGGRSSIWEAFLERNLEINSSPDARKDDVLQTFTQDYWRSASIMIPGKFVVFNYTTQHGKNQAYFAMIVAALGGRGVYANRKTKNNLMTCFLIDSGTNLNTLSILANILEETSDYQKRGSKSYSFLSDTKKTGRMFKKNKKRDLSRAGLNTLFPSSKFRTFILTSMETVYEIDLDG